MDINEVAHLRCFLGKQDGTVGTEPLFPAWLYGIDGIIARRTFAELGPIRSPVGPVL